MILQRTRLPKCPPAVPPPRHPPSLPLSSSTEAWQLETPTLPQRPHAARHSAASLSLSCDLPLRFFLPCLLSMFQPHFPFPSSLLHSLTGHLLRVTPPAHRTDSTLLDMASKNPLTWSSLSCPFRFPLPRHGIISAVLQNFLVFTVNSRWITLPHSLEIQRGRATCLNQ